MKKKLKPELAEAFAGYFYHHATRYTEKPRQECYDELVKHSIKTRHNGIRRLEICAGTIYFTWQDGKITEHNFQNYLECFEPKYMNKTGGDKYMFDHKQLIAKSDGQQK